MVRSANDTIWHRDNNVNRKTGLNELLNDTDGSENTSSDPLDLENHVSFWLIRLSKLINADFTSKTRHLGLTVAAIQTLSCLASRDGLTVSELSIACFIEQPTLTKILNRLESDKLIRRKASKRDKRLVQIHITAAGRKMLPKLKPIMAGIEHRVLAGLSQQDIKTVTRILGTMTENVSIRAVI